MYIKVFSPATVANLACGFDILGLALQEPGDVLIIEKNHEHQIVFRNETDVKLPLNPDKNVTGVALKAMLNDLKTNQGFTITFQQKIPAGSGIGSSAASSVAGIYGANLLLGEPFRHKQLIPFAMQGEKVASGTAHADNVAPALLGGITLIRSYNPLDIIQIPFPEEIFCAVIFPDIEVATKDSRKILPKEILLKDAIVQWGNIAGLISGLYSNDYELIGNSLCDEIIEPVRAILIPGFYGIKEAAMKSGALGCSISGSGPSIFALCRGLETAEKVGAAMKQECSSLGIVSKIYLSGINKTGIKKID